MELFAFNWEEVFKLEASLAELVLRGSIIYLGLLFLMRVLPRRTGGELEVMDLLFVILIAEAVTHSLGTYSSVPEAFVVVLTFVAWNYLVNYLSYHFGFIEKLVKAPELLIIKNGKLLKRNMRREYITEAELMEHLRKEGYGEVHDVQKAYVESDGTISVVGKKQ